MSIPEYALLRVKRVVELRNAAWFAELVDASPALSDDAYDEYMWEALRADWAEGIRAACARTGRPIRGWRWCIGGLCNVDSPALPALLECIPPADRSQVSGHLTMVAVKEGLLSTVRDYLDAGVDPNWYDDSGGIELQFISWAAGEVLRLLLDRGMDPTPKAPFFHLRMNHIALDDLHLLLARGMRPAADVSDGMMHEAMRSGRVDVVRLLEAYGYRPWGVGARPPPRAFEHTEVGMH